MRNRFPGTCYRCGERVEANEGLLDYKSHMGSVWPALAGKRNIKLIEHDACHDKYRNTDTHYLYAPEDVVVIE